MISQILARLFFLWESGIAVDWDQKDHTKVMCLDFTAFIFKMCAYYTQYIHYLDLIRASSERVTPLLEKIIETCRSSDTFNRAYFEGRSVSFIPFSQ